MKGSPRDGADAANPEIGLACLPPELIGMILGYVGDCDFCRCCQASALFWVPPTDAAIETRKRRWRGCREPHDFCATGNTEALALLSDRGVTFDVRLCVVNAIAHGHGKRILALLRCIGLVASGTVADGGICDEWRQKACSVAARNGRTDILTAEWHPRLGSDCIIDSAIQGDSLAVFQWACEASGISPRAADVWSALRNGAVTILAHCRRVLIDRAWWVHIAETAAHWSFGIEAVLLCMGDDAPPHAQSDICYALCGSAPLCDVETFYGRFPDAFNEWCLSAAVDAKRMDVARWLCERFPTLGDRLADRLVGLPPIDRMFAVPHDCGASVKWLYGTDLIGDVPQLVRIAAERGATGLAAYITDHELPFADLSSACGF
ncbi:hypothetical protein TW95_gp0341 [Pandoravirus inopinatum]|uniref:Ankyrin repeat protein n=1 Tax=Pandoravirus inopinatum TaxID=1605721 RepID=A0A0B5J5V2_9VIRU|nr:hypothetical protein TW95_gp0341 [Pandoravirus inopinatum]AJF97075.1 hypothetical protein [Pandoravirus inopinatum]